MERCVRLFLKPSIICYSLNIFDQVDCSGGGQFQSMGLENMVSAFALIAAAAIVALIILLWELVKGLRKPRLVDKDKAKDHYQASPSRPFARDTTPIPSD